MSYKELEYMDLCTIYDLETEVVDENGDTTHEVVCENIACDFQSQHTETHNGVLVQYSPFLYLPYDFEFVDKLSHNLYVIISRWRKSGTEEIVFPDDMNNPEKKHLIFGKIQDYQEVNVRNKLVGIEIELAEIHY